MIGSMLRIVWYAFNGLPTRSTDGKTNGGKTVLEGQRWNLKKQISPELPSGIYIIRTWMGDRILMTREDGVRYLPPGAMAIYETGILDDQNFELVEKK